MSGRNINMFKDFNSARDLAEYLIILNNNDQVDNLNKHTVHLN